jgi:hypothetical protein
LCEFGGGFERSLPEVLKLAGVTLVDELSFLRYEVGEDIGAGAEVDEVKAIARNLTVLAQSEE